MGSNLPDFLIVGAAKAGTTSLFQYLEQHPSIFLPTIKEPKYFVNQFLELPQNGVGDELTYELMIKSFSDYLALFKEKKQNQICGEASVDYLYYSEKTIPLIKEHIGDPKIIILLRDPVKRGYSAYNHLIRDVRESFTFEEGLDLESKRIKENYEFIWYYKQAGLYYSDVKNYIENFSNVKVLIFEEFIRDPEEITNDVFKFLGVNEAPSLDVSKAYNNTGTPKNKYLQKLIKGSPNQPIRRTLKLIFGEKVRNYIRAHVEKANLNSDKTQMSEDTGKYLSEFYKEDKRKLEQLLNIELNFWL